MDTQRLILFVIFSFSLVMLWEAWNRDHRPPAPPPVTSAATTTAPRPADVPPAPGSASAIPATTAAGVPPATTGPQPAAAAARPVTVKTDLYTAEIDPVGGAIAQVALAQHRDAFDTSKPYLALQRNAERTFVAQAGLLGEGMPNHRTVYEVQPGPRELAPGQDKLDVKLTATGANGDKVTQTLTFHRGTYLIDATFDVANTTGAAQTPFAYFQLTRDTKVAVPVNSMAPAAYVGPVVYNATDHFKKVEPGEIDKLAADPARKSPYARTTDNGWIGMLEHYFVAAWLPSDEKKIPREFYTRKLDNGLYSAGVIVPSGALAARRDRAGDRAAVRGPAGPGPLEAGRDRPRPVGRLRDLHR
jgi:YidC/Oxa1 family membrane protein insertase